MEVTSVKRIHQSDWTDSGVRFLRARDIVAESKNEAVSEPLFISQEKYDEYSAISGKVKTGDLLVTGVGTIGVPMLINSEEPLYFKDGNIIWFKNENSIDGRFFYHSFNGYNIQKFIKESAGTGTVGTYTIESGKKTPINLPQQKEEQKKIGAYFSNLDHLITLHQRKCEETKTLKKYMLQKMFPQNGQSVPEIRFSGFTEDWEQRKWGDDLVSIHTGTNMLGSTENAGMPLLKMGNIQRGYFDISKMEFLAENDQPAKEDIANYGDFFFNTRNTLELVGKGATWMGNSGKYAFNSNIARFELKDIDTIFFNYLYNTANMTRQIHARAMGTTSVAAIYPRTLESVEYLVPCMQEQKKIGAYFSNLDHLITLHQRKCEELQDIKKYMLQNMFV